MTTTPTATTPRRIQRKRTRGWTAPLDAQGRKPVYVGRSTRWGNPFTVAAALEADFAETTAEAREVVADTFRCWLSGDFPITSEAEGSSWSRERRDWIRGHIAELRGRDLMCWCPEPADGEPDHCHAAVLLALANGGAGS